MKPAADRDRHWSRLMADAQKGNAEAYRELLCELSGATAAFLQRRLSNRDAVEDITQEVLLSVDRARRTYDPMKPFSPWFFSILRRRYVDYLRKLSRRTEMEIIANELDWEHVAEDRANGVEAIFDLDRSLARLPQKQRRAFTLLKIEGYSVAEVAEQTGMSQAAVKVSAHRARKALKKQLEIVR